MLPAKRRFLNTLGRKINNNRSSLIFDSVGNIYGTTAGGPHNTCNGGGSCGTVFEIIPP